MLTSKQLIPLPPEERQWFEKLVPPDHFLRQVAIIDFEAFRPVLESAYKGGGRPPLDCLLLLKLELLGRQYRLSDREVIGSVRFNIAFRLFLGISLESPLPHPSLLCHFRRRLGPERLQQVFDLLVAQARQFGLVKDRLRLKDATHILASLAVPSTLRLVAEVRDCLLEALRPFAPDRVAEEEARAQAIRVGSEDARDEDRLVQRVDHLRDLLAWAHEVPQQATFPAASAAAAKLEKALTLAHKALADRDDPDAGDQLLSIHDPDARCGKHGTYYDGYLLDVLLDADSEIITALNVLPANGDEAADAVHLLQQEEQAHGNDVEGLSIDAIGYRGDLLRTLTDPEGLNVEVTVPPRERIPLAVFGPKDFTLSDDGGTLTCPAGQSTTQWERNARDTGRKFRFARKQCGACPQRAACLATPTTRARTVIKNDYEAEYQAAQARTQTAEYAATRKEHPAIERKLSEMVNRHDLRQARHRSQRGVLWQAVVTGFVVNCKRIVHLMTRAVDGVRERCGGTVRAELAAGQ